MYVAAVAEKIESSGLGEGNSFSIAASAKAFEVLSTNLYANKILAVIREISCNAADAHRMAGLPLSEIKVHLPTFSEPYFSVRDYGPGLSLPDMLSLYTTFFRSTKDQDNSQIGGFGLGSKSPFAVADQFTVTSWHGGYTRSYVCYKDSGLPHINLVSEDVSDYADETGIEVQVAAKDFYSWEREARSFFQWWPELPTIIPHTIDIKAFTFDTTHQVVSTNQIGGLPEWTLLPDRYSSQVFMGLVAYPLDWSAIPNLPAQVSEYLSNRSVFLRLPIGAVSISPSREALSYDPSTCTTLLNKLREIVREAIKVFKTRLDQQPSLYDARLFVYSQENHRFDLMKDLARGGTLTWHGHRIPPTVSVEADDFGDGITFDIIVKKYYSKNPQRYLQSGIHYDHGANSNDRIYWSATAPRDYAATFMHNFLGERDWRVIIIKGGTFDNAVKVCLDKGLPAPNDYALLAPPPAAAKGPRGSASSKTTGYVFDQVILTYDRTAAPIDLSGGGLYFEFVGGEPFGPLVRAFNSLRRMGFFANGSAPRVIGLSRATLNKSKTLQASLAAHGWRRFDADWVQANVPDTFLEEDAKACSIVNWLTPLSNSNSSVSKIIEKYTSAGTAALLKLVQPYLKQQFSYDRHSAGQVLEALLSPGQRDARLRGLNAHKKVEAEWRKFLALHPMLSYVNFGAIPEPVIDTYINR